MPDRSKRDRRVRAAILAIAAVIGCALNALYPAERLFGIMS